MTKEKCDRDIDEIKKMLQEQTPPKANSEPNPHVEFIMVMMNDNVPKHIVEQAAKLNGISAEEVAEAEQRIQKFKENNHTGSAVGTFFNNTKITQSQQQEINQSESSCIVL